MKELPEGWEIVAFPAAISGKSSFNNLKIKNHDFQEYGKYPIIDQGDNEIAGYTNAVEKVYKGELPVVIFGDHTLVFKFVDFPFSLGADGTKVLVPDKSQFDGKFFYYALRNLKISSQGYSRHYKFLKEKSLVKPPLPTQHRIVAILEKAEQVKGWHKEQSQLLDDYLKSVFLEMFGDPGTNPKGWDNSKLMNVTEKVQDGSHFSPQKDERGGKYMYISAKHIKHWGFDLSDVEYVSDDFHKNIYKRCDPKKGDVIYIKDGATAGLAKVNLLDEEFSMLSSIALIRTKKSLVNPFYLEYHLNHPNTFQKIISQRISGSAITRIILKELKKVDIPTPPIALQNKFAAIVQQTGKVKAQHEESAKQADDLFNALMQKAFTGELVA